MTTMRHDGGYTLIELLVVMAILAIVAGSSYVVAVPSIQNHRDRALCNKVNHYLQSLQQQAWQSKQHMALSWQAPYLHHQTYRGGHWQHQASLDMSIPRHTQVVLHSGHTVNGNPSILFAPNLITSPFNLHLERQEQHLCHWQQDANGPITMTRSAT